MDKDSTKTMFEGLEQSKQSLKEAIDSGNQVLVFYHLPGKRVQHFAGRGYTLSEVLGVLSSARTYFTEIVNR